MLKRYEVLNSRELDHTREVVGRVLTSHRLELLGPHEELRAVMRTRRLRDTSLNYVSFGGSVRIAPGPLERFFVVQTPLSGRAEIRCGNEDVLSEPGFASVISPTEPLAMRWSAGCIQLITRIERTALEARLSDLIDAPLHQPLRFVPGMDVTTGYGYSWRRAIGMLVAEADRMGAALEHPLVVQDAERCLMTMLLALHPNNYSNVIEREKRQLPARPRAVRIAVDWIESSPEHAHTTASLARAAAVSERALQLGFRAHLDVTPMEYLRTVRLRRVRDELRAAQPDSVSVSEVATHWGLPHLGHFSKRYQQMFGEKPSETLRRGDHRLGPRTAEPAGTVAASLNEQPSTADNDTNGVVTPRSGGVGATLG